MNNSLRNTVLVIVAIIILAGGWLLVSTQKQVSQVEQHMTWHNATSDMITVSSPQPGQTVGTQFNATGAARGTWYFEASFPVAVLDKNGTQLAQKPAQALSNWMTNDFVQFNVALDVGNYSGPATLVLKKDNPSGDPAKERSVEIPIVIQ